MDKRIRFFQLVDEIAKDDPDDPWTKEPWPRWFENIVLRFARVFIPTLKRSDSKQNRERFEGYGLAFISQVVERAKDVDTTKFPKGPFFTALKRELRKIAASEARKTKRALKAAVELPHQASAEVLAGYTSGLKKQTLDFGMARMGDSQTAQICLFLIFARPFIEAKRVATVTVLFDNFMKIREAFPGQKAFFKRQPNARRSLERQFRRICTEDGVRLRGPGQPKRIKTAGR